MKARQYPRYCATIPFTPDLYAHANFSIPSATSTSVTSRGAALARPFRCYESHSLWETQTRKWDLNIIQDTAKNYPFSDW
jgi:hypothetical protein